MTTRIFIRARNPNNGARVVEELLELGMPPERLQVYGKHIPDGLPVKAVRWQPQAMMLLPAMLIVAVALPLLTALLLGGIDAGAALLLALVGAGVGAAWQRYRTQPIHEDLAVQQEALRSGDLMIVADVDSSALERVQTHVAERHPEILLLGPDPAGSPPFP
jgi:hypothetical protein